MTEEETVQYYKNWLKEELNASGIGTGKASEYDELIFLDGFCQKVYLSALGMKNYDLCQKVKEYRESLRNMEKKMGELQQKMHTAKEEFIEFFMKL